jgi:hypothetical protein
MHWFLPNLKLAGNFHVIWWDSPLASASTGVLVLHSGGRSRWGQSRCCNGKVFPANHGVVEISHPTHSLALCQMTFFCSLELKLSSKEEDFKTSPKQIQ